MRQQQFAHAVGDELSPDKLRKVTTAQAKSGVCCCILVQYVDHLIKVLDLDETSCSRLRSNPFFTSPVV